MNAVIWGRFNKCRGFVDAKSSQLIEGGVVGNRGWTMCPIERKVDTNLAVSNRRKFKMNFFIRLIRSIA